MTPSKPSISAPGRNTNLNTTGAQGTKSATSCSSTLLSSASLTQTSPPALSPAIPLPSWETALRPRSSKTRLPRKLTKESRRACSGIWKFCWRNQPPTNKSTPLASRTGSRNVTSKERPAQSHDCRQNLDPTRPSDPGWRTGPPTSAHLPGADRRCPRPNYRLCGEAGEDTCRSIARLLGRRPPP